MRSTAAPLVAWRAMRSRIPSRTCESSAVVGSSAMSSGGSAAIAAAMSARWRRPPLSWPENWPARRTASGIPASAISSSTRRRRSATVSRVCSRRASSTSLPTLRSGSSATRASWLIMPTVAPRSRSSDRLPSVRTSTPATSRRSAVTRDRGPASPTIDRAVTLLPEPDSPTRARHSPGAMAREIPSTAPTASSGAPNRTVRFSTRSVGRMPAVMTAPCSAGGAR